MSPEGFESDLVLNFAMCSFINLRDRIHDPVLKCSTNCFKEIYLPFNPIFLISNNYIKNYKQTVRK